MKELARLLLREVYTIRKKSVRKTLLARSIVNRGLTYACLFFSHSVSPRKRQPSENGPSNFNGSNSHI